MLPLLGIFSSVFVLFWSALTLSFDGLLLYRLYQQWQTYDYVPVDGIMLSSAVKSSSDGDGTTYSAAVKYQYYVKGQQYTGTVVRYGDMGTSDDDAEKFVQAHPAGAAVRVYYDPAQPASAVLRQGPDGSDYFMPLFLAPFNCVMLAGWWWLWHCFRNPASLPAAGYRVIHTAAGWRLRLPEHSPLAVALITGGGTSFMLVFVCAFTLGFHAAPWQYGLIWLGLLGVTAAAALVSLSRLSSGRHDLVYDELRGIVTLPANCGRKAASEIKRSTLVAAGVATDRGSDPESVNYRTTLFWNGDAGAGNAALLAFGDQERAEALANWLRNELKLRQATPEEINAALQAIKS